VIGGKKLAGTCFIEKWSYRITLEWLLWETTVQGKFLRVGTIKTDELEEI